MSKVVYVAESVAEIVSDHASIWEVEADLNVGDWYYTGGVIYQIEKRVVLELTDLFGKPFERIAFIIAPITP